MIKDFPSPDRKKRVTREKERLVGILLVIGHHPRLGLANQEIKEVSGRCDKGCVRDSGQSPHPH